MIYCFVHQTPNCVLTVSCFKDMSKLLDVCRQSIVFESVMDIATCLNAISDDEDVSIVRIKNRLDLDYDSSLSAGYRDVCVNLRFLSDITESLGLERHVCEVQLVLLPYAKLKVCKPLIWSSFVNPHNFISPTALMAASSYLLPPISLTPLPFTNSLPHCFTNPIPF